MPSISDAVANGGAAKAPVPSKKNTAKKTVETDVLRMRNAGTRRIVIGPPPKSARKGISPRKMMVRFDTKADVGVPSDRRLGDVHTVDGAHAAVIRESLVVNAMAEKLGLQIH